MKLITKPKCPVCGHANELSEDNDFVTCVVCGTEYEESSFTKLFLKQRIRDIVIDTCENNQLQCDVYIDLAEPKAIHIQSCYLSDNNDILFSTDNQGTLSVDNLTVYDVDLIYNHLINKYFKSK